MLVLRETYSQSLLSDLSTLSLTGILFWFNYNFIGGNNFVDCLILFIVCITTLHIFKGKADVYIDNKEAKKAVDDFFNN